MPYKSGGFSPLYNGFVMFPTGAFGPSRSLNVRLLRDVFYHNTEFLHAASAQVRVNWNSINPIKTGESGANALPVTASRLLTTDGVFQLQLQWDGTPMPLYVRANVGLIDPSGSNNCTGSVFAHLRQGDRYGNYFAISEIASASLEGTSSQWVEFYTYGSQCSASSSILEILPPAVQPPVKLALRGSRSLNEPDANSKVKMTLCWLDLYGQPTGSSPCAGFEVYGVYAQEFVPSRSFT